MHWLSPDGAAASQEADDHDEDADGHEDVGQREDDVDLGQLQDVLGHVGVHPQPDPHNPEWRILVAVGKKEKSR
ncbi:hypothetical protein BaRGS_00028998 [Batillaria attramentaria]|uniref:Uncharacterized protein n=1 Tax=Batillaria attramentaria TaxID=370345 RepID=A0ABD0JX95_9CAEN